MAGLYNSIPIQCYSSSRPTSPSHLRLLDLSLDPRMSSSGTNRQVSTAAPAFNVHLFLTSFVHNNQILTCLIVNSCCLEHWLPCQRQLIMPPTPRFKTQRNPQTPRSQKKRLPKGRYSDNHWWCKLRISCDSFLQVSNVLR